MAARNRKRKRFRPKKLFKRLIVLATFVACCWLVFWAGSSAFRLAAGWLHHDSWLQMVQAGQVADSSGIAAQAVTLRQETVILADKPGRANLLAAEGTEVTTGQRVVELVDKALLANIETELAKLDKPGTASSGASPEQLTDLQGRLSAGEAELQTLMDEYRLALRERDVDSYLGLYRSLNSTAKQVAKLQQDRAVLLQSQHSVEERRAELEASREQAVVPVFAPAKGRISFVVDGLGQVANPANVSPSLFDQLRQAKSSEYRVTTESSVAAGQPVFKIATGQEVYLLVQLPAGAVATINGWTSIYAQFGGDTIPEWALTSVANQNLGADQCLFKASPEPGTAVPRFADVTLHTQGEVLCSLPKGAVLTSESGSLVFILDGTVAKAQAVQVRQTDKNKVTVTGIAPGATVISNPAGLTDGADVSSRLRK